MDVTPQRRFLTEVLGVDDRASSCASQIAISSFSSRVVLCSKVNIFNFAVSQKNLIPPTYGPPQGHAFQNVLMQRR